MRKFHWIMSVCLSFFSLSVMAQSVDAEALEKVAHRLGVSEDSLVAFHSSLKASRRGGSAAEECLDVLGDSKAQRSDFLKCLTQSGDLGERTYGALLKAKSKRIQSQLQKEVSVQKTILLLSWLEDVVRESLAANGKVANIYNVEKQKFVPGTTLADFLSKAGVQSGDILLSVGDSSISSIIPQSTFPPRRFSHAFFAKVGAKGRITLVESLIETGVKRTSQEEMLKHKYHSITVLRLKQNLPQREKLLARMLEVAESYVGRPYDNQFDVASDKKIFCSELVAASLAKAMSEVWSRPTSAAQVLPEMSVIPTNSRLRFLSAFGISNKFMPSPGDLLSSQYFDIAVDYRNTQSLFRLWGNLMIANTLIERADQGYVMKSPGLAAPHLELQFRMTEASGGTLSILKSTLTRPILGLELGLIPSSLNGTNLAFLWVYNNLIFEPTRGELDELLEKERSEKSLISLAPWRLQSLVDQAYANNRNLPSVLAREK